MRLFRINGQRLLPLKADGPVSYHCHDIQYH